MQPQMKPVQERPEHTTSAHAHEESGVRAIPAACRAMIAAEQINFIAEPPVSGVRPRKPFRASTEKVCPKMIETHMPLVHQVVTQISCRVPANVLRDDLVAAGIFGLVDSLRKNGGDGGETFEWYARMRIRGAVLDELRAQDWLTRRGRDAVNAASLREDGESDAAVLVGLDDVSLNEEQEFLAVAEPDPAATYESKETMQTLIRAVERLPERERLVIFMYYFEEARFKEIGVALGGVCEPRVSQIHYRALGRLKSMFEEKRYRAPKRYVSATPEPQPEESGLSSDDWENSLQSNDLPVDEAKADVA